MMAIIMKEGLLGPIYYGPFSSKADAITWAFNKFGPAGSSTEWTWKPCDLKPVD